MQFNSIEFAIFLPIVFLLYWYVGRDNNRVQNWIVLVASYIFYGWWDVRFLALIVGSSVIDYYVGKALATTADDRKRRWWLGLSLAVNLGALGFFKYFNFFAENFATAFTLLGSPIETARLEILLPVGISFYTFQTLSYSIDVYRRKLTPTDNLVSFMAYVSFFPQLVAGPIERASHLLPQFARPRTFDYRMAVDGMRQVLWGLVKKVVIADNAAQHVNLIFNNHEDFNGSTLLLGAVFFAFQIYGDFSGYSDIAIGTARLFGVDLRRNFAYPYFSRDIAEFWRRWHISLSTWFRDYLYIPLGGSRGGKWFTLRNVAIIFLVSGFWHGANWTFIVWGGLHALYFVPLQLLGLNRRNMGVVASDRTWPTFGELGSILLTFVLTTLAWVFFRSDTVGQAIDILGTIGSSSLFEFPTGFERRPVAMTIILIFVFLLIEWAGRRQEYAIERLWLSWPAEYRRLVYVGLILAIFWFSTDSQQFIYFQF